MTRSTSARLLAGITLAASLLAAGPALAKRTFVYVHDRRTGGGILAFELSKDGLLTPLPGSPFASPDVIPVGCGGLCQTMEYSTKRKALVTGGPTGVTVWQVASDGTLAIVPGSPFGATGDLLGTSVAQKGKRTFVYASEFDADAVRGFELGADGTLSPLPGSPFAAGDGPDGLVARRGLVFVANQGTADVDGDSTVSTYTVSGDGSLVPAAGNPVPLPASLFSFNVGPDATGKRLYVADQNFQIFGFAVNKKTAALTPMSGSPFGTALVQGPFSVAVSKKLVFAFGFDDVEVEDEIQPFAVRKGGVLENVDFKLGSPFEVFAHAIDAKGKRLIVAGPTAVVSLGVTDQVGHLAADDEETVLGPLNPNAIVIVKR